MKKVLVLLTAISIFGLSTVYAGGPQGAGKGPKPYQGAGIGKEVSTEAKELKGTENKTQFGETVRTQAQEKTRIQEHKRIKLQKHKTPKPKPQKKGNQTESTS
ncbi:MAG: hypothetical protein C0190_04455 [Thermodesulfobacterium geofontis]|uniref:Uncharacterized protein n=1 Tax=Thermodesulfobacterium geofontis TaxID=1295609 RepID=A0A2N7PNC1_9BACT|nr:MAG: hypothetical protein C0190_04455 [Thermodesulfobacterium geofontis]